MKACFSFCFGSAGTNTLKAKKKKKDRRSGTHTVTKTETAKKKKQAENKTELTAVTHFWYNVEEKKRQEKTVPHARGRPVPVCLKTILCVMGVPI